MGTFNAQQSNPMNSNNKSSQLNNMPSMPMPGVPPGLAPHPCFMNFPNQFLPLQNNNHMGIPQLGQVNSVLFPGQPFVGFIPQGGVPNSNNVAAFNMPRPFGNMNQINPSPLPGQFFPQNLLNLSQQNMNQLMAVQMSNPNQFGLFNVPPHQMLGCLNQVSQAMGPPNAPFVANPQFGMVYSSEIARGVNANQTNFVQPSNGVNALPSNGAQQVQGNLTMSPGNHFNGGNNTPYSKWKNSSSKNFKGNPKNDRFQKSQFQQKKSFKKNFGGFQENGATNDRGASNGFASSMNQAKQLQKRSLSLNYTEQEIQLWREQRRKNFPSKANAQKKQSGNPTNTEAFDQEAKLRREQLKEILTKQAELGVEVAEVPSHYLSDPENQLRGRKENNKRALTKRERFQNKGNKRRRYDKREKFANKQHQADNNSSGGPSSVNVRKPTLLEKLLSVDIRRDRSRLLQVFRFMVMNSFFNDLPEKPLKFPLVVVQDSADMSNILQNSTLAGASCAKLSSKDSGYEVQGVVKQSLLMEECTQKAINEPLVEEIYAEHDGNVDSDNADDNDDDDDDDNDEDLENKAQAEKEGYLVNGEAGSGMSVVEEEGEIIE